MVIRVRLAAALAVAVIAFVAAWLALLPGVAFWDTGEFQAVGAAAGHGPPDRLPDLRPPRLAGLGRAPAVRRAGVPDEPAVRRSAWPWRPASRSTSSGR